MGPRLLLDWGSSWKYQAVTEFDDDPAYADPDLDDSGWSVGAAAFGNPFSALPDPSWETWNTVVDLNQGIWLRADVDAFQRLEIRRDSWVWVYWNGELVWTAAFDAAPVDNTDIPPNEPGVLAVFANRIVRAGTDGHYLDLQLWGGVPAPVRQYPRDDGLGHSSAARKFPPVKARRIAGGYQ